MEGGGGSGCLEVLEFHPSLMEPDIYLRPPSQTWGHANTHPTCLLGRRAVLGQLFLPFHS